MKFKVSLLVTFTAVLALSSCEFEDSSDVNQDKIYTDYELFYNSNTDKTIAIARFKFGSATGTPLELNDPAYVLFNGDTLDYNFFYSGHIKEYAGLVDTGSFIYSNVDGQMFSNTVPQFDTIAFPASFDTIVKSQSLDFAWEGTPLAANQHVGIFIGTWSWGEDALYEQDDMGATNVVMGTGQLSNLTTGNATVYMDRSTEVPVSEGTSEGGLIRGKYRAANAQVWVME